MIRSSVPNVKATSASSHSLVSLQDDSKGLAKAIDKEYQSLPKSEKNKANYDCSVSSNKSNLERFYSGKTDSMHRMMHYVTMRKKQRKYKGGIFSRLRLKEQFLAKENYESARRDNRETFPVSHALSRNKSAVNVEKSREEEDLVLMIHDLLMLSEMTSEGTYEKFALQQQIDGLRNVYERMQKELPKKTNFLKIRQHHDQPVPSTDDKTLLSLSPVEGCISVQFDDHFSKDQILLGIDCESRKSTRTNVHSEAHTSTMKNSDDSNNQSELKEIEVLQSMIVFSIAQRDALRKDFDGFCAMISDLLCNTKQLNIAEHEFEAMEASKDALSNEKQTLFCDINNQLNKQRKICDKIIEGQTHQIDNLHQELTYVKEESDISKETAASLVHEMNSLSLRYNENLKSVKVLQGLILEEEVRSASLLLLKDLKSENIHEGYDVELVKMKNEISVTSLENVVLSSKINVISSDLQYAEKMVDELNVKLNVLLSSIDQLKAEKDFLHLEVCNLTDISTAHQQSALNEQLELFHELNQARSTILRLRTENTSLSLEHCEPNDKIVQSDIQQEIATLRDMVEKIQTEKEALRSAYLKLFEQVVYLDSQNSFQLGILMDHGKA